MEKTIEIPEYKVIVPNSTWGKELETLREPLFGIELAVMQLMQITRYTAPTDKEVIQLIQKSARETNCSMFKEEEIEEIMSGGKRVTTEDFLRCLPTEAIKDIAAGEEKTLLHLKRHFPERTYQPLSTYIYIVNCSLPKEIVESSKEKKDREGRLAYKVINNGENKWNLQIRLNGKNMLPEKSETEFLLGRGVRDSDTFRVEGSYESYDNVASQIRMLYSIFNSPQNIECVYDSSEEFIRERAHKTTVETTLCIAKSLAAKKLIGGLARLLGDAMKEADEERRFRGDDYYGACSNN